MASSFLRSLKNRSKLLLRSIFEVGQRLGFDILPRHFYSEIPNIRALKSSSEWKKARSFFGIPGNVEKQIAWVDQTTERFRSNLNKFEIHADAVGRNGSNEGYGEVEADFLYCFVRSHRPAKIVQIGSGVSTAVCLRAAKDEGYSPYIICIEPYPTDFLKRESAAGRIELVAKRVQDVGAECASWVSAGDLFFVDSSHTLAPAGEVNQIVFEMLPRLAAGTYIHFHDIYFPYDYNPDTLSTALFFQHETALFYAFLLMNDQFEVLGSLSLLHHQRLDDMVRYFPDMKPMKFDEGLTVEMGHFPSSIFLRRIQ
jgi:hypothetical protein